MTGTTSTVNDLLNLLSRLRAEETTLREQFEGRLASLHKRIEAVQMTLEEFTGETHAADVEQPTEQPSLPLQLWAEDEARTPRPPTTTAWAQKLHGLTQIAALERIAEENNGVLRVAEARRILIAAGLVKGRPQNVSGHLYQLLNRLEQFEKADKGTYRLMRRIPILGRVS